MKLKSMMLAAAILASAPALAHEEMRIVGTIAGVKGAALEVKMRDGKTAHITIDSTTGITKDKATVPAAELKAGLYVVVDGLGDDITDVSASQIRIVPPPK